MLTDEQGEIIARFLSFMEGFPTGETQRSAFEELQESFQGAVLEDTHYTLREFNEVITLLTDLSLGFL